MEMVSHPFFCLIGITLDDRLIELVVKGIFLFSRLRNALTDNLGASCHQPKKWFDHRDEHGIMGGLGNRQVIAGYYDAGPALVTNWLNAARPYAGICGVVYTTWQNDYSNLEQFDQYVAGYPAPRLWLRPRLLVSSASSQPQLLLEGERGHQYVIQQTTDLSQWTTQTNFTAQDATVTFPFSPLSNARQFFRAALVQ